MLTHFHPDHALGLLRLRYSSDKIDCYHPKDKNGLCSYCIVSKRTSKFIS
ncbi:MAG: hypothetical protein U9Q83_06350 [Bacteroidota bacterium]|nr:hypothetical protein [Bacteroidota bacterium]